MACVVFLLGICRLNLGASYRNQKKRRWILFGLDRRDDHEFSEEMPFRRGCDQYCAHYVFEKSPQLLPYAKRTQQTWLDLEETPIFRTNAITPSNVNNDDQISNLPDDMLLYMIVLLPVECSMRTWFLSKQWSNLWKTKIPELNGTAEDISALVMELFDPYGGNLSVPCRREVRFRFGKTNLLVATF